MEKKFGIFLIVAAILLTILVGDFTYAVFSFNP